MLATVGKWFLWPESTDPALALTLALNVALRLGKYLHMYKVKPQTRVAIALNFAGAGTISTLSEAAHNLWIFIWLTFDLRMAFFWLKSALQLDWPISLAKQKEKKKDEMIFACTSNDVAAASTARHCCDCITDSRHKTAQWGSFLSFFFSCASLSLSLHTFKANKNR